MAEFVWHALGSGFSNKTQTLKKQIKKNHLRFGKAWRLCLLVLDGMKLTCHHVDQAGLKPTRLCLLTAGTKGVHHQSVSTTSLK